MNLKQVSMKDSKNCQSTKYIKSEYDDLTNQSPMCSNKNCQSMWTKKPRHHMQSVTKTNDTWLSKPELQDCVVTRTVNVKDATRNLNILSVIRTINLQI